MILSTVLLANLFLTNVLLATQPSMLLISMLLAGIFLGIVLLPPIKSSPRQCIPSQYSLTQSAPSQCVPNHFFAILFVRLEIFTSILYPLCKEKHLARSTPDVIRAIVTEDAIDLKYI